MKSLTTKEVQKECRKLAREVGATFKQHSFKINGSPAYYFENRTTGRVLIENCTLGSAYENLLAGYVEEKMKG